MSELPDGLAFALDLGFTVFPCRAQTLDDEHKAKEPLTEHGKNDATADPRQIEDWARRYRNCAWGGRPPEAVDILDIDHKNQDGFATLAELEQQHSPLPQTLTSVTPSLGQHRIFNAGRPYKNRAGVRPGLDVRSNAGYILLPPSIIDAGVYKWLDTTTPIAAAPDWLIEEVFDYESKHERGERLTLDDEPIEDGHRNDTVFRYACSLRGRNIARAEAWVLVQSKNQRSVPPLGTPELTKLFDSAWSYDVGEELTAGMELEVVQMLADLRGDVLVLPNDHVPFPWAAHRVFTLMGTHRELFYRGGVVELKRDEGERRLQLTTATEFRSRIDARGRKVKAVRVLEEEHVLLPKRCSSDTAAALLATKEAAECLPPIELVTNAPVLVEHGDALLTLGPGYHEEGGGVLVLGGEPPAAVPLETAVAALLALTADFLFTAPADRSRAVAGFIGPAIRSGNMLPGHALINCVESDKSQTGKGYLVAVQQSVHGEAVHFISQTQGGVGSFDERLAAALIRGRPFIAIDNVRGRLDSTYLESIITSYSTAQARVPYRGQVTVNVRRMTFQMTSNGIEVTLDLGNRMLITRLLHQPASYRFKRFPEGGLLEHVQKQQALYLGCVHCVVRHWYDAGKPLLATEHSFSEWVGALDWIVQQVFQLPPLLEGHSGAVARAANPALSWLRSIALAAVEQGRNSQYMSASQLRELSEQIGLSVPNTRPDTPDEHVARVIGKHMGFCFREHELLQLDSLKVRRHIVRNPTAHDLKLYVFWRAGEEDPPPPRQVLDEPF